MVGPSVIVNSDVVTAQESMLDFLRACFGQYGAM